MARSNPWQPPPDPDFERLAHDGLAAFHRDQPSAVAFDTETEGLDFYDPLFCVTAAWRNHQGQLEAHYFELEKYDATDAVRRVLGVPTLIGHNTKFDLHRALNAGLLDRGELAFLLIEDTEALSHLDDEHRSKRLKSLAVELLGYDDIIEVPVTSGPNKGQIRQVPRETHELNKAKLWAKKKYGLASVKDVGYHLLPRGIVTPYAIKDADFTWRLWELLLPRIEKYPELADLYHQEMRLTMVLLDMEARGMGVNPQYVDEQVRAYQNSILRTELRMEPIVGKSIGKDKETEFNPNSNPQLREFFESAGFPREDYEADTLKGIDHPLAQALLELRSDQKVQTYFQAIQKGQRNGIFHPSIRQHGTVSGRTSSGKERGD